MSSTLSSRQSLLAQVVYFKCELRTKLQMSLTGLREERGDFPAISTERPRV